MKFRILSFVAAAMFMATACGEDAAEPAKKMQDVKMTVHAMWGETYDATRVCIEKDPEQELYHPKWEAGDEIDLCYGEMMRACFSAKNIENGIAGHFTGTIQGHPGDELKLHAIHPYVEGETATVPDAYAMVLPTVQNPGANTVDKNAYIAVAEPKEVTIESDNMTVDNFRFKRIVSIVKLDITNALGEAYAAEKVVSVKLSAIAAEGAFVLTGNSRVDLGEGNFREDGWENAENYCEARYAEAGAPTLDEFECWMAVNPFELTTTDKLVIEVETENYSMKRVIENAKISFNTKAVANIALKINEKCAVEEKNAFHLIDPANLKDGDVCVIACYHPLEGKWYGMGTEPNDEGLLPIAELSEPIGGTKIMSPEKDKLHWDFKTTNDTWQVSVCGEPDQCLTSNPGIDEISYQASWLFIENEDHGGHYMVRAEAQDRYITARPTEGYWYNCAKPRHVASYPGSVYLFRQNEK